MSPQGRVAAEFKQERVFLDNLLSREEVTFEI